MKPLLSHDEYLKYPILYVDDEPLALETFKAQFEEDFSIYTANNADEALALLAEKEIFVLLADQRMPGLSGVELLARVKESHPEAIRMLITAYSDMEVVVDAINSGNVYRYVSKPYNEDEVRNMIRQGIETTYLIRDRKRLEAEKAENTRLMARANRLSAVGTLAAGMAHEINNPLTAVSAFLQMLPLKLQEKKRDEEYFDPFYQKVCEELGRIQNLIARLLRYSRYGGQEEYLFKETHINELLEDMVTLLKPEAKKRCDEIKLRLDPAIPTVFVDQDRIKQVFMNFLLNAIQATEKGTITLSSGTMKSKNGGVLLKLTIEDTGSGISKQHIQKLFDPFFTTKHHEGSGLGLLTCHHIIEAHGGVIDVQSETGKGARFTVHLPLDPRSLDLKNPLSPKDS
ncbi:MAG TPA: ATP-binding protein, partial [Nitrospiria bacterium]|nr:ATP-binding protein [Nitrospiria bacterium]